MRYLKYLALGALMIVWGLPLQAAQLNGLYEAEVAVPDQGRTTRARAMDDAMAAVLLKVGGSAAVLEEEAIKKALSNASRFVQQYRYRSESDERGSSSSGLMLWVGFDKSSIDNLLRTAGMNVWGENRPATLVWLAVEEGSSRQLVGANDQGLVRNLVESEAQRRAIPLVLPLLDLTDQSKVRPIDVWSGFFDNLKAASKRYESQAILVGKLYQAGRLWEARWTLLYQGERREWQKSGTRVSEVIAAGVGGTADYLSSYFSSTSYTGQEELALHINNVGGLAGFRRVSDYLRSLHGVSTVTARRIDATSASFRMQIVGGRDALLQAIGMGDVLVKADPPYQPLAPATSGPAPASYGTMAMRGESGSAAPMAQAATVGTVANTGNHDMESGEQTESAGQLEQPQQTPPVEELFFRLLP